MATSKLATPLLAFRHRSIVEASGEHATLVRGPEILLSPKCPPMVASLVLLLHKLVPSPAQAAGELVRVLRKLTQ